MNEYWWEFVNDIACIVVVVVVFISSKHILLLQKNESVQ